jgi:predicted nucleotidyltransferase
LKKCYTIDEIREIVSEVAKEYGVEKVSLFGSYARGDQDENSDIDLVIKKGKIKGFFQFFGFKHKLEERLGKHVDILTCNSLEQSLIKDALLDEVVLYE